MTLHLLFFLCFVANCFLSLTFFHSKIICLGLILLMQPHNVVLLSCYFRGTIGSVFHFLLLSFLFVLTSVSLDIIICRIDWRGINFASEWCIDIYITTACLLHTLWELFHPNEVLKNILTYAILEPQQLELGADAGSYGSGRSTWTLFWNRSGKKSPPWKDQ